jgi:hypothetical protein
MAFHRVYHRRPLANPTTVRYPPGQTVHRVTVRATKKMVGLHWTYISAAGYRDFALGDFGQGECDADARLSSKA